MGKSYEIYDRNQLNRNNQIAHPDKFDRYFQLDIDSIAYKTADILNVIHNFDEHDIQNGYDEYFSTERALSAIETCKKNRTILELPEELQHICAAFFLANSGNPECGNHIYQHATEKLISSWRM